jgi:hypothetical protein
MPATFDDRGLKFLYPDNWTVAEWADDTESDGVTFDLPTGGYFSIEPIQAGQSEQQLIDQVASSLAAEYGQVEREPVATEEGRCTIDLLFYYLDLIVISRLKFMRIGDREYLIQMQAESRDFDANQLVFDAIVAQLAAL